MRTSDDVNVEEATFQWNIRNRRLAGFELVRRLGVTTRTNWPSLLRIGHGMHTSKATIKGCTMGYTTLHRLLGQMCAFAATFRCAGCAQFYFRARYP